MDRLQVMRTFVRVAEAIIVVELGRQGPAQPGLLGELEVLGDARLGQAKAGRDGGLAQAGRVTEAEQLAKVAHGQSFGGHLGSSLKDGSRDPGLKIVSSHRCSIMKG